MLDLRIKREDIGYLRLLIDIARLDQEKFNSKNKGMSNDTGHIEEINRNLALFNFCL